MIARPQSYHPARHRTRRAWLTDIIWSPRARWTATAYVPARAHTNRRRSPAVSRSRRAVGRHHRPRLSGSGTPLRIRSTRSAPEVCRRWETCCSRRCRRSKRISRNSCDSQPASVPAQITSLTPMEAPGRRPPVRRSHSATQLILGLLPSPLNGAAFVAPAIVSPRSDRIRSGRTARQGGVLRRRDARRHRYRVAVRRLMVGNCDRHVRHKSCRL